MRIGAGVAEVNSTRLAYELEGEGPAVVLVHGFTLDRTMWDDQISALAERYRVICYDLRGFGESDPPEPGVAYTHADDLAALLSHLGIERVAVVGLSLGGWVALEFALTYPELMRALVLVDAALRTYPFGPWAQATIANIYGLGKEGRLAEAKAGWLADPLFACPEREPAVPLRLAAMVDRYSGWHLRNDDPHPPMEPPAISRLGEVKIPTLVIVGDHDLPDFHDIAALLAARIPHARQVTLPGAGHMANMDAPDAFNRTLLAFLTEINTAA